MIPAGVLPRVVDTPVRGRPVPRRFLRLCPERPLRNKMRTLLCQLFSSNTAPQERQCTVMRPFPLGTRIFCPQFGHLK